MENIHNENDKMFYLKGLLFKEKSNTISSEKNFLLLQRPLAILIASVTLKKQKHSHVKHAVSSSIIQDGENVDDKPQFFVWQEGVEQDVNESTHCHYP